MMYPIGAAIYWGLIGGGTLFVLGWMLYRDYKGLDK